MNTAIIRVKREIKKCMELKNFEISANNLLEWHVKFIPQTDIFRGRYDFIIKIPNDYPFNAPKLNFIAKIFHPNIDRKGETCLSILSEWKSKYTIETIFTSILSIFQEPNLENPINLDAAKAWSNQKLYLKKMKEYNELE